MDVLDQAIVFATKAHEGQKRKFSGIPYVLHPLEVASIIATMTTDREVMAAGVLHDTVEDCGVDLKEIKNLFGAKVAALVQSETEDKLADRPESETWKQRKEETLLILENTKNLDVKIMWLADKLSNIRSFYREYLSDGDKIWQVLNQKDPKMQCWYYKSIQKNLSELSHTSAYLEYDELLKKLFGE